MPATCGRKTHDWDETGRSCRRCGARRTRMPKRAPRANNNRPRALVPLAYGNPYCELCRTPLAPGDLVSWRRLSGERGERWTVYCRTCHWSNLRAGKPLT